MLQNGLAILHAICSEGGYVPESDCILKLHRRGKKGINIWHSEVKGPRKTRKVKGYIVDNPVSIPLLTSFLSPLATPPVTLVTAILESPIIAY